MISFKQHLKEKLLMTTDNKGAEQSLLNYYKSGQPIYINPKPSEVNEITKKNNGVFRGYITSDGDLIIFDANMIHGIALKMIFKKIGIPTFKKTPFYHLTNYGVPIQGYKNVIYPSESVTGYLKRDASENYQKEAINKIIKLFNKTKKKNKISKFNTEHKITVT